MPEQRGEPSPYVSIYLSRRQAEAMERILARATSPLASSNPLAVALCRVRNSLLENANGKEYRW